jgi:hypothetical protein
LTLLAESIIARCFCRVVAGSLLQACDLVLGGTAPGVVSVRLVDHCLEFMGFRMHVDYSPMAPGHVPPRRRPIIVKRIRTDT